FRLDTSRGGRCSLTSCAGSLPGGAAAGEPGPAPYPLGDLAGGDTMAGFVPVAVVDVVGPAEGPAVLPAHGRGQVEDLEAGARTDFGQPPEHQPAVPAFVHPVLHAGELPVAVAHLHAAGHIGHEQAAAMALDLDLEAGQDFGRGLPGPLEVG